MLAKLKVVALKSCSSATMIFGVIFVVVTALFSATAQAREYPDLFPTPRAISMGRAMTAIADDYESLYYNPAGLALIETWQLRAPELIQLQASPKIFSIVTKIQNVSKQHLSTPDQISAALQEFDGTNASLGIKALGFGYFRQRMGIMLNIADANTSFRIRTPSILFAKIQARATVDSGLSLGYAQPLLENHVRVGAVLRPFLVRGGMEHEFTNADITQLHDTNSLLGVGWGYDFDLGAQANLDPIDVGGVGIKPMAGVALQNMLGCTYSNSLSQSATGQVPPLQRRANIGVGASVEGLGAFKPTFDFDLRDIFIDTNSFLEHVSAGIELLLKPRSWFQTALRGHFYKGNIGGGIAGKLLFGELEFGTYAVNLGNGPGIGVDRRIYLSASAAF